MGETIRIEFGLELYRFRNRKCREQWRLDDISNGNQQVIMDPENCWTRLFGFGNSGIINKKNFMRFFKFLLNIKIIMNNNFNCYFNKQIIKMIYILKIYI